ncbi:hypothetical protein [Paenibacillus marchantiophytorum]|uniref:hypothetical protein n=1 Tax=Paenibacillus marchantiophytorum TaxID=1619310 RepID=UPI0016696FC0|nr:hypothetical protein [Paenibacillus marchantiophytorum]
MKIAYINSFPEIDQLDNFIQTYTEECINLGSQMPVNWQELHSHNVISVYDEDTLVGIGYCSETAIIHVRPTYGHREIETMVNKLLQAELKLRLVHK